jgi:microcompartment protein CcmL/EutN
MSALDHEPLAGIETLSVPAGLVALDGLAKEAAVEVVFAGDIDPSRFLVLFCGDLSAVESALQRAIADAGTELAETLLLPRAHQGLRAALHGQLLTPTEAQQGEQAVGLLQCHTVLGTLAAVDRALKAAPVQLMRLRLANELAGQGHAGFAGDLYDVEASLEAARAGVPAGVTLSTRQIARPAPEVYAALAQRPFGARSLRPLEP